MSPLQIWVWKILKYSIKFWRWLNSKLTDLGKLTEHLGFQLRPTCLGQFLEELEAESKDGPVMKMVKDCQVYNLEFGRFEVYTQNLEII